MAQLPSNTFMFNYNAREYNSSTRTFPKTEGQLFDEDLVLNTNPMSYGEDYVYFGNSGAYKGKTYVSEPANPFNRDSSHNSITLIYKTSGDSGNQNIVANRGGNYNYMARSTVFHTNQSDFLSLTANTDPHITLVRIYADGKSERKFLDSSGNVLQSTSASSISWGSASNAFGFFSGYGNRGAEYFQSYFYWMYCSLETLTDAEVLKVIQYNENTGPTFEVDTTAITATYSATTSSVTLTAEEDMAWTASTSNGWITLSTTGGTGSSVFTVSVAANKAYAARNGLVTLTNGEDVIEITVEQEKYPLLIPNENIYRADLEVVKAYRSGSTINKAYRSGELIYYKLDYSQPTPPVPPGPAETPLTFNITSDGAIKWAKSGTSMQEKTILYKLNDGEWTSITSNSSGSEPSISVVSGDTIQFKGDNATYSTGSNAYTYFIASGATFTVSGNIMSLIDSTDFATATVLTEDYALCSLFKSCTGLTDASKLVLPATTLTLGCYRSLFDRCSNLTSGAELPATTLANDCYRAMFYYCSRLTTAPELPATGLTSYCYYNMFCNCSGLITAPELPATTLVSYCYYGMFQRCINLNYIKCLATDISASRCTYGWVSGVSSTGTFETPSSTNWSTGNNGIPSGWTRVDA